MRFGIDRLIEEPELRRPLAGKRIGLLAHPASVTHDLVHSLDALAAPPYDVVDDDLHAALEARSANNAVRLILPRDAERERQFDYGRRSNA